ncbi:MAG: selenide, water dikinase SelD [Betaproteobacteria bacterium]|nr:selenide, water dikinase SelD [Betaproteobacteria bacterium]
MENVIEKIRLTQFSHGGGCGCKIAPAVLSEMLARLPAGGSPPELLIGTRTSDDAAVYRLNDQQALIATTDFFMPIVDDPFDFGRIAAANALSDIYAMGGSPILALALVGMPIGKLPLEVIGQVLEGGASMCREAGIPVAGGHSIDSVEPIYGLAAMGLAHPEKVKSNAGAKPGDVLILGKPLGIGVLSAALKSGRLDEAGYQAMIAVTTQLNRVGMKLGLRDDVHAMTDVTGFGLLGHLLELCRGSGCCAELAFEVLPVIEMARGLAQEGVKTGASARNWSSYGDEVTLRDVAPWQQVLLTDPQTSGGLLVACAAEAATEVLALFHAEAYAAAAEIGRLRGWEAGARVVMQG